jgi:hypothetical protein
VKVHLSFVPPGGGETDYSLIIEMPTVPQTGDYISITRPGQQGAEDFIVKRTWWNVEYNNNNIGSTKDFWVECEFALGPYSSEIHQKSCQDYYDKTGKILEFDESMY